ncbi:adenosylmethionine decarboxylase [Synechococcus sp. O70.2]|jgi:S-adenosylmethionine decarboxylase|uniref:adenosylmethionine decarboxylase n=1 Tax=unclassified Synechococcus TaxID=2626047 RepID=UPI0039C2C612
MVHTLSGQLGDRSLALIGIHCILELYDCPAHLLDDVSLVQQALREAARRSNSTLLGELYHPFEPQGITALALLGESHISIHTWPEVGYAAVDVFTCGRHTRPEAACEYLIEVFQARRHSLRKLPRRTTEPASLEEVTPLPEAVSCETARRRR